jgi:NADH-quinone oxidoreductase subunit H
MERDLVVILENPWLAIVAAIAGIMGYLTINAMMLIWLERKLSARIQRRLGPTEHGPFGLLQSVADMGKLLSKELLTPDHVHKPLYLAAPVLVFMPVIALCSLFPISPNWVFHDFDVALVLLLAIGSINIVGIFIAGWGSNNKYALLGAVRSVAQNISYEIPLILSVIPIVLLTGSLSLYGIAAAQTS